jgi:hypothetical protein
MLPQLPPELLLACLLYRPVLSDQLCETARNLIRRGLDWNRFLDSVIPHRMFPLVSNHASQALADVTPPRVRSTLRSYAVVNGARADAMANELVAVLTWLEDAGIRAVPLKGPVLIERIWGDCRLMVSHDLDILVRPDDARRAAAILAQHGYRLNDGYLRGFPLWKLGSHSLPLVRSHELYFPIRLDLETTLEHDWFKRSALANGFWERLQRRNFRGTSVWLLPDDWIVVLVALHALRHLFQSLHWAGEVYGLMRFCPALRSKASTLAAAMGVREEVQLAQEVCEAILGETMAAPEAMDPLVWRLAYVPFYPPRSRLAEHRLQLAIRRKTRMKIAYILSGLFRPGPGDAALVALPRRWSPTYYLIRPIRLAMKYLVASPISAAWTLASGPFRTRNGFRSKEGR